MKQPTFTVYRDRNRQWRWSLRARNNNIIAVSGESYTRRHDCLRAVDTVLECIFNADIRVKE